MSDVITIQPGAGSFTDTFGNVFTIDAGDNNTADINGQAITPNGESSKTGALQLNNGSVYRTGPEHRSVVSACLEGDTRALGMAACVSSDGFGRKLRAVFQRHDDGSSWQ